MNTKGNQRFENTENKIRQVLTALLKKKRFSEVTVSEICQMAGIHRTTFYSHYEDIYDLMRKYAATDYQKFYDAFTRRTETGEQASFQQLFEKIRDSKEFYKAYLDESNQININRDIFLESLKQYADDLIPRFGYENLDELYYHQTFFCAGLSAIIQRWILNDCKESPEEMCRILDREYRPNRDFFIQEQ